MRSLLLLIILFAPATSWASKCSGGGLNLYSDVSWKCMFPMVMGGVKIGSAPTGSQSSNDAGNTNKLLCKCKTGIPGFWFSMWDPSRLVDTVTDPYCFMPFGKKLKSTGAKLGGNHTQTDNNSKTFAQVHYMIFPTWNVLGFFMDVPCIAETQFDVAFMTEIIPTWNDDVLSAIITPESILFSNPLSVVACSADSIAALARSPLDTLFWCMGSWGNAYPMAGSITGQDYVSANAGLAARATYMMSRLGLLQERTLDGCGKRYTPIWHKSMYKFQLMRPVQDNGCRPIGRTGYLWTSGKHPIVNNDNMMWMQWRKLPCCLAP